MLMLLPDRAGLEHLVRVTFAGVAITQPKLTREWLESKLNQRAVWFSLLQENQEQNSVRSIVYSKKVCNQRGMLGNVYCPSTYM